MGWPAASGQVPNPTQADLFGRFAAVPDAGHSQAPHSNRRSRPPRTAARRPPAAGGRSPAGAPARPHASAYASGSLRGGRRHLSGRSGGPPPPGGYDLDEVAQAMREGDRMVVMAFCRRIPQGGEGRHPSTAPEGLCGAVLGADGSSAFPSGFRGRASGPPPVIAAAARRSIRKRTTANGQSKLIYDRVGDKRLATNVWSCRTRRQSPRCRRRTPPEPRKGSSGGRAVCARACARRYDHFQRRTEPRRPAAPVTAAQRGRQNRMPGEEDRGRDTASAAAAPGRADPGGRTAGAEPPVRSHHGIGDTAAPPGRCCTATATHRYAVNVPRTSRAASTHWPSAPRRGGRRSTGRITSPRRSPDGPAGLRQNACPPAAQAAPRSGADSAYPVRCHIVQVSSQRTQERRRRLQRPATPVRSWRCIR